VLLQAPGRARSFFLLRPGDRELPQLPMRLGPLARPTAAEIRGGRHHLNGDVLHPRPTVAQVSEVRQQLARSATRTTGAPGRCVGETTSRSAIWVPERESTRASATSPGSSEPSAVRSARPATAWTAVVSFPASMSPSAADPAASPRGPVEGPRGQPALASANSAAVQPAPTDWGRRHTGFTGARSLTIASPPASLRGASTAPPSDAVSRARAGSCQSSTNCLPPVIIPSIVLSMFVRWSHS
jgi:hypothetical protein